MKLINNNEIIKKVNQVENLIKAQEMFRDKELNLFDDIEYIKQKIKETAAHECTEKNIVCNKIEGKTQCIQTNEYISTNISNFGNVLNYKDEIFSLKEKEFQYKEKIKSYETQLEEIIKHDTVLREIIKEFKKEREKIKKEEAEAEADEKHVKQLEESIRLLKENMMRNTGRVGTDVWKTVEKMRKEISDLKNNSLTQVTKGNIKKDIEVSSKNNNDYNIFEGLISSKTVETVKPKPAQQNSHLY